MTQYFQSRIFSVVAVLLPSVSLLASPSDVYQTQTTLQTLGYAETNSYDSGLVDHPTAGSLETAASVVYGSTLATASGRASAGRSGCFRPGDYKPNQHGWYRLFAGTKECLDPPVLLDPLEKQFHLQATPYPSAFTPLRLNNI